MIYFPGPCACNSPQVPLDGGSVFFWSASSCHTRCWKEDKRDAAVYSQIMYTYIKYFCIMLYICMMYSINMVNMLINFNKKVKTYKHRRKDRRNMIFVERWPLFLA